MRLVPTRVHGILDYTVGTILAISPWLFRFNRGGAETWVPFILGAGAILYSLFTNYEWGVSRRIPLSPHRIFGILEIVVPLLTKLHPAGLKHITGGQKTAAA